MKKIFFLTILVIICSCASQQKVDPKKLARVFYKKGTQDLINKNYTSALSSLKKAYEYDPENDEIINNMAMAYYFKKSPELALKYLKNALSINNKNTDALTNIATIYMNQGQYSKAKAVFEKTARENLTYKNLFRVYYNLGLIELKNNSMPKAIRYFNQAIAENEDYCPAHFKLAEIAEKANDFSQALEHYKSASGGTCQDQANVHYLQAMTYIKLKQYDSAKFKLQEIMNRFPRSKESSYAKAKLNSFESIKLNRDREKSTGITRGTY